MTKTGRPPPPLPKKRRRAPQGCAAESVFHRGYYCTARGTGMFADHKLWRLFPDLPRTFHWRGRLDHNALCAYIDALYAGRIDIIASTEKAGIVSELTYPEPHELEKYPSTQINVNRLLDCLALRDNFRIPLWGRINLVTDGNRLVPSQLIGALMAHYPEQFAFDTKAHWQVANRDDLLALGGPHKITTGMYREGAPANLQASAPGSAPPAAEATGLPPAERTIRRRDRGSYVDWLTEVRQGDQRWYVRRLYRDTHLLYVTTAWSMSGPWTVQHRDTSALLALGIDG